jgi:hypothetical protein
VVPMFVWESQEALHKSKTKRPRIELTTQRYATSPHLLTYQKLKPTTNHYYATLTKKLKQSNH